VRVPAGKWLTTPIVLKSRVNLHLEAGAEVGITDEKKYYFSSTPRERISQDYPPDPTNSLPKTIRVPQPSISARDAENLALNTARGIVCRHACRD
jgi:polygalacturonase